MPAMMLSRADIARLIPHAGVMCLLDTIQRWDKRQILCTATSHRDPAHPLREGGRLHAVAGIEYAAQAIAAHRGLSVQERTSQGIGVLAAVREVVLARDRLDDLAAELIVEAETLVEQPHSAMYRFAISAGGHILVSGRATVMMVQKP